MSTMFVSPMEVGPQITEVPAGATAVLRCNSNDDEHNFMFWQLGQNQIIGPGNDYDHSKYKYEVLSGKLHIKAVTPDETGFYRCISKNIDKGNLNIGVVEMVVKKHGQFQRLQTEQSENLVESSFDEFEIVKIIFILISLIVICTCGFILYKVVKAEKKRKNRLVMLADDDDDEGSGDEIYNRTTTIINDTLPGPSNSSSAHITGIDNQGLDTDFNAAFEQISIDVANRNLV